MRVEHPAEGTVLVRLSGSWKMEDRLPAVSEVQRQIETGRAVQRILFDTQGVTAWDTGLLAFVSKLREWGSADGIEPDLTGLPEGIQRLLRLADVVPPRKTGPRDTRLPWLARVGTTGLAAWAGAVAMLTFIGEVFLAVLALLRGKARLRGSDLALYIDECGAEALPIVTLISFLVGLILAFVGAVQLQQFGAQIYVANLVGIAMAREMGAMMTGIIMAGRTGAAFAAQLGTMKVNQEIDALKTMGISPMEFLVLPRMLALVLMMPLLCLYADLMGILGGARSASAARPVAGHYFNQTQCAVDARRSRSAAVQGVGLRGPDRPGGLPARHAVRAQRLGGGRGDDLGRGDGHRVIIVA